MKKLFIVANWKSNKTTDEAIAWLQEALQFGGQARSQNSPRGEVGQETRETEKEIIVCAPFTLLSPMKTFLTEHNSPIKLGAQDVSPFGKGAYTGAVNAEQIKEFAEYVIIGHSERRQQFGETDEILAKKVTMALSLDLIPIFCVQGKETSVPEGVEIVAFEPMEAIGSGQPDTPEDAESVAKYLKMKYPQIKIVLYGGSVTPENVSSFTTTVQLDGVLVGGASLEASSFYTIVENV